MVVHAATGCLWHAYTATHLTSHPLYKGDWSHHQFCKPLVHNHDFSLAQLWFLNSSLVYPSDSSNSLLNMGQVCCALKIPSPSILESRTTIPELIFVCSNAALDPRFAAIHVIWQVFPELHGNIQQTLSIYWTVHV
jgi:hypothetical protein